MKLTTGINKKLEIKNGSLADVNTILKFYDAAIQLQTQKNMVVWPRFERSFIEKEIREERHWKIMIGDEIACVWSITFEDKEIWGEKDDNNSIYIHRFAANPTFRGNRFIDAIVPWAKRYALARGRKYIRLDTLGHNTRLIEHYISAGFEFLGIFKLTNTQNLAAHYQREPNCCFFEMAIDK
jgi:ribosomal protein S18 acetylase RimI-like enzyme